MENYPIQLHSPAEMRARDTRWLAAASAILWAGGMAHFLLLPKLVWHFSWYLPILGLLPAMLCWLVLWVEASVCFLASLACGVWAVLRGTRWPAACAAASALALLLLLAASLLYPSLQEWELPWLSGLVEGLLGWLIAPPDGLRLLLLPAGGSL